MALVVKADWEYLQYWSHWWTGGGGAKGAPPPPPPPPENRFNDLTLIYCLYVYGTAKKKRPGYLVGNLVATNWPIEKALHAIGYNQISTK